MILARCVCISRTILELYNLQHNYRAEGAFPLTKNHYVGSRESTSFNISDLRGCLELWMGCLHSLSTVLNFFWLWQPFKEHRFKFLWACSPGKWVTQVRFRSQIPPKSENRGSQNGSLVRSGGRRLFLDAYWVDLGWLGRSGMKLGAFPEIRILELNKKFSKVR